PHVRVPRRLGGATAPRDPLPSALQAGPSLAELPDEVHRARPQDPEGLLDKRQRGRRGGAELDDVPLLPEGTPARDPQHRTRPRPAADGHDPRRPRGSPPLPPSIALPGEDVHRADAAVRLPWDRGQRPRPVLGAPRARGPLLADVLELGGDDPLQPRLTSRGLLGATSRLRGGQTAAALRPRFRAFAIGSARVRIRSAYSSVC